MKEVDHDRRGGYRDIAHRAIAAAVEMLMPGVQWRGEKRAFLPFECALGTAFVPSRGGPAAANNINHLFKEMPLWLEAFTRRNFADIRIIGFTRPFETDPHGQSSRALPGLERHILDVSDEKPFHQSHPFCLDP